MATATTTFVHQVTVIEAEWCNDVDQLTYEVFPGENALDFYQFDAFGNSVLNNSDTALGTSATDGFLMVPSTEGTPAGTPGHLYTGTAPCTVDEDNDAMYIYTNSAWHRVGDNLQWFAFVASDQTGTISADTDVATIRAMPACTILEIRGFVVTASSSGAVTIDVHLNGTTIMTTNKLVIDEGETTTLTAATAPTLTTTTIASGDVISVDIDGAGTGAVGWGVILKVRLT